MASIDHISALRSLLASGRHCAYKSAGRSMFPLIWPHRRIVVCPVRHPLSVGRVVVVVSSSHTLVAHRVVGITPTGVVTQGDSVLTPDAPVPMANVVGEVFCVRSLLFTYHPNSGLWLQAGRLLMATAPLSRRVNNLLAKLGLRVKRMGCWLVGRNER